ncbi:MAG TPA: hypothetical protein VJM12_02830 [Pyrinomonadaceae bacterium]|nr:hypothetical protein [Pyrinomonadaceae bacterium]
MMTFEQNKRRREKGAALLTVLLVSTMLLAAGGALLLTANAVNTSAIDSTAEAQAYYAAEGGLNMALNVLRGNSASATVPTFRNVVDNEKMDQWFEYKDTGTRQLVMVSDNPGLAYEIAVSDPDNTLPAFQPRRLLLNVIGYGPKGSSKRLEMLVDRHTFDYSPLATILMRGASDNKSTIPSLYIGESNAKTYSGFDNADPTRSIPAFGTTHADDFNLTTTHIEEAKPNTVSGVDKVSQYNESQLPTFLQTADLARSFLNTMQEAAMKSDRYFKEAPASFGSDANPQLTFVDGDVDLPDGGAGLLIVTGKLLMSGNPGFNGLILVLGEGYVERDGGGNANIFGAMVVAKFDRIWPAEENDEPHDFLAPTFVTNGAGTSKVQFDSVQLDRALSVGGLRTMGIREH